MRIISHGDKYEIGQLTCNKCGCVFAYTKSDIKIETWTDYDSYYRDEYEEKVIRCPECNHRMNTEGKSV